MAWTETFCLYVLLELPFTDDAARQRFLATWRHLRSMALYALRFDAGQHNDQEIFKFKEHARAYARACEEVCHAVDSEQHHDFV